MLNTIKKNNVEGDGVKLHGMVKEVIIKIISTYFIGIQ